MDLKMLERAIGLDEDLVYKLDSYDLDERTLKDLKRAYYEDFKDFKESIKKYEDWPFLALVVYLDLALDTYKAYMDKGIGDAIYIDSMKDLRIWAEDYKKKQGTWGIDELDWLAMSLDLKVIRLGRLQYEKTRAGEDLGPIKECEDFLSVHIAEDGPLKPEGVDESLDLARAFYADQGIKYFYCQSWLLSPRLDRVLDESSNIIKFRNKFTNIDTVFDNPQAEERIFGRVLEDKSLYPEATSLQRKAKKAIMDGFDLGIGSGYIPF